MTEREMLASTKEGEKERDAIGQTRRRSSLLGDPGARFFVEKQKHE
jgi:hypothetical protein